MHVEILPALRDNYIYLIHDGREAAAVDPGEDGPVRAALARLGLRLRAVLLTHAHADHVAGAAPLRAATGCEVIGPADAGIDGLTRAARAGDRVAVPGGALEALDTPGHLPVHLAWHDPAAGVLFSGDALFGGGCGRVMGGAAPATLWQTLQRLRALPVDTKIYFGHEYSEDNLAFAAHLEPGNAAVADRLAAVRRVRAADRPTTPTTLAEERKTNPFLRADQPEMAAALALAGQSPEAVFIELRHRKNHW